MTDREFHVSWSITVEAASALDAASQAERILAFGTNWIYEVVDSADPLGEKETIDMQDHPA